MFTIHFLAFMHIRTSIIFIDFYQTSAESNAFIKKKKKNKKKKYFYTFCLFCIRRSYIRNVNATFIVESRLHIRVNELF